MLLPYYPLSCSHCLDACCKRNTTLALRFRDFWKRLSTSASECWHESGIGRFTLLLSGNVETALCQEKARQSLSVLYKVVDRRIHANVINRISHGMFKSIVVVIKTMIKVAEMGCDVGVGGLKGN